MKRSLFIIILIVLGITVSSPPLLRAHSDHDCDIAGAWVASSPPIPGVYELPAFATVTISPNDPTGRRFSGVVQPVNPPNAANQMFPDADRVPDAIATWVRSGRGTYRFTWINHVQVQTPKPPSGERGQIITFFTYSGTAECLDENTVALHGMLSLYSAVDRPEYGLHNQDKNQDGLPDAGEVPFLYVPWNFTFKRLPLMAP